MKQLKKAGTWFLLLNKRFLKKYSFTALLFLVFFLVLGLRFLSGKESGILRVLLYQETGATQEGKSLLENLRDRDGVIHYEEAENPEDGRRQVARGKADCFWILPADPHEQIRLFLEGGADSVISVYVREDTVWTKLAREQLYGTLYPVLTYEITRSFLSREDDLARVDPEELEGAIRDAYGANKVDGSLIRFAYLDDADYDRYREQTGYLIAPLRGMLALMVLVCALALAMFFMQDEKDGIFCWMPVKNRKIFPAFYILTGLLDAAAAVWLGLLFSGTFTDWKRELLLIVLYMISTGLFANLLRLIFGRIRALGAAAPVLLIITLILCPVFLNIRRFPVIQYLLPPYYYLNSVHSDSMIGKNLIYLVGIVLLTWLLEQARIQLRKIEQ